MPLIPVELHGSRQAVTLQNGGNLFLHIGKHGSLAPQQVIVIALADQPADLKTHVPYFSGRNLCHSPLEAVSHTYFLCFPEEPARASSLHIGKQRVDDVQVGSAGGQVAGCQAAQAFPRCGAIRLEAETIVYSTQNQSNILYFDSY